MNKPREMFTHCEHRQQTRLIEQAQPSPRGHFRASELGGCPRRTYFDMIGEKPRPQRMQEWYGGQMGNLYHDWIVENFFAPSLLLDCVEGVFNSHKQKWHNGRNTSDKAKPYRLHALIKEAHGVDYEYDKETKRYKFVVDIDGLEVHFRPDGVIIGIIHDDGTEEEWPRDEWELLEVKSTTIWGVDAARKSHADPTRLYGWYPSYVIQCQLQMHALGLKRARIAQGGRDLYKIIMDQHEPATSRMPEIQHQWVPYDENLLDEIVQKMKMVKRCIDLGELPMAGCAGTSKDFVYNGCPYNAFEVAGLKSSPCCTGLAGEVNVNGPSTTGRSR